MAFIFGTIICMKVKAFVFLLAKIVGTKDNIEKKVLDYIDVRMNDKSMIRVIKFSVSIKSGKYTAYDWTYKLGCPVLCS